MLDPSYIRSIRDGIINGNIEANNQEALPDGLVGLYDQELFPPTMKWKERRETLEFFLVFAIAQKEISADFAATILGDEWFNLHNDDESKEDKRLQKVNDLIQLHSKRFSSAGGVKYRLYHERFRLYILQKVLQQDISQFNDKFISLCETALKTISEKEIPEKESYALEFISTHYFISAMQGETECLNVEKAAALRKYAYDHQYWERQIKASKGFEWSKKMLNQMMTWASKFNEDDEVIECALNKVDLYHQEQNDAPRIVQLVAEGDVETALKRIEKFGGNDLKQKEKEFRLITLSILDLLLASNYTELDLKQRIIPLSNRIRELAADFYWPKAVDSYTFFKVCFELHQLGVEPDLLVINDFEINFDWIADISELSNNEIIYLTFVCGKFKYELNTISICCLLSSYHLRNNRDKESSNLLSTALSLTSTLKNNSNKEEAYFIICKQIVNNGNNELLIRLLSEMKNDHHKEEVVKFKIAQLSIFGNSTNLDDFIHLINDDSVKNKWMKFHSMQALEKDAMERILNIQNLEVSSLEKLKITTRFLVLYQNQFTNSEFEDIFNTKLYQRYVSIKDPITRTKAALIIVRALNGKLKNNENEILHKIINWLESLRYSDWKNEIYNLICAEFLKQNDFKEAKEVIIKSLKKDSDTYNDFSDQRDGYLQSEYSILSDVADVLIEISSLNEALKLSNLIMSANRRTLIFFRIIDYLLDKSQVEASINLLHKTKKSSYKKYSACKLIIYYLNKSDIDSAKRLFEDTLSNIINFEFDFEIDKLNILEDELNQYIMEMKKELKDPILFDEFRISQILGRENKIIESFKDVSKFDLNTQRRKIFEARNDGLINEHLMNMICINKLFLSRISQEKLDRYNRTLNLQWAIDIKNKISN